MTKLKIAQNISVPFIAKFALNYARNPKRIAKFASFINAKIDVPLMNEEEEQAFFVRTIGATLDAVAAAVNGSTVISAISQRDTCRDALGFLREAITRGEPMGEDAFDIPFMPEWMEDRGATYLISFIDDVALPWVDTTPRLQ